MAASVLASSALAQARPKPVFPATPVISNPYLPMKPRTSLIYDGKIAGKPEHDVVTTLSQTKTITGIHCVVQKDTAGNVWYMGEFATQYVHGKPAGHAGSWQAGVNGAGPGIVMEAHPNVGDSYLQEN